MERVVSNNEALAKLIADKKILAGGVMSGRRGVAFIMETASNEELSGLVTSLPLFPMQKVDVTPLESFEAGAAANRQSLERFKAALQ